MKADAAEDIAAYGAGKHDVRAGVPAPSTAPAPTSPLPRPSTASGATADAAQWTLNSSDAEPEVATAHSCIMPIAGLRDAAEHALNKEWFASSIHPLTPPERRYEEDNYEWLEETMHMEAEDVRLQQELQEESLMREDSPPSPPWMQAQQRLIGYGKQISCKRRKTC